MKHSMKLFAFGLSAIEHACPSNPLKCTLGVFPALAFVVDFLPVAPKFHQRTHRVRLRNLGTTDKKSSHRIKHKKIPRVH